jgi:hypothetical protein
MNLLRNPFMVGALAFAAVGVLIYDLGRPARSGKLPATAKFKSESTSAAKTSRAQPASAQDGLAGPMLEVRTLETNAPRWEQAPRRDPFRSRFNAQSQAAHFLSLKGIWRQTGSALAVINDRVVAENDRVLDFSIEKIEPDRVWVVGPNGREGLLLNISGPPMKTRQQPGSSP